MAAYVAYSKEYVISSDILGDVRFSHGIPFAGTTVKAAIGIPIVTSVQGNCIGVIELYRDTSGPPYNLVGPLRPGLPPTRPKVSTSLTFPFYFVVR